MSARRLAVMSDIDTHIVRLDDDFASPTNFVRNAAGQTDGPPYDVFDLLRR